MNHLLTNHIATMTEMREPHKVIDSAGGKAVAIMKNSKCVGYFVPAEMVEEPVRTRYAARKELVKAIEKSRARIEPVLDYLKDK